MSKPPGPWGIADLSDLLLGPRSQNEQASDQDALAEADERQATDAEQTELDSAVVLVDQGLRPFAALSDYAEYWSNRAQPVALTLLGEDHISIRFYDHMQRRDWASALCAHLDDRAYPEFLNLFRRSIRRLVLGIVTRPGWENSPFVQGARSACVLVEPSQYQLVRAYETIKQLAYVQGSCAVNCFVVHAQSPIEATSVATRVQQMGRRFLDRDIGFEGFSGSGMNAPSNRVEEARISAADQERFQIVQEHLLALACASIDALPSGLDHLSNALLPVVRVLPSRGPIRSAADLDELIGHNLETLCDDYLDSGPMPSCSTSDCCLRWVRRRNGARAIVVCALCDPTGFLENAAAHLHPARDGDEIMLVSISLSTARRRAAQCLIPFARLFEASVLPGGCGPSVLLKDVTEQTQ